MNTDYFEKRIHQRKQEIFALERTVEDDSVELDQTRVGRLSRMDAMQIHHMNQAVLRRKQEELIKLNATLKRIERGEFGICEECGENINPKRLEIDLTASFCISCAQTLELTAS